jgi:hypothetical protein
VTDHDVLSQHIDALRSRSVMAGDESATQDRIVASLRARRRRKRHMLRGLMGVVLLLPFGSTSYAMIYGVPAALRPLLLRIGLVEAPVERATPRKRSADATPIVPVAPRASAVSATSALAVAAQAAEPSSASAREAHQTASRKRSSDATRGLRSRAVAAPIPEAVPIASSAESDEAVSRQLYARAHELHFVARDREAALRAWDDYLARAPLQVMRIEAEYNRALCLVRLGRNEEALRELAPFADGTHGAYRRRESAALVRALSR